MPKLPGPTDVVTALLGLPDTLRHVNALARDARRVVARLDSLLDDLEDPLRQLAPGLTKLAQTLERDDLAVLLAEINDTHRQVAAIAATTGRIVGVIDDVSDRVSAFPFAGRLGRPRTET
jgi:ABC-type transporter Mla subunit MlaD